MIKTIDVECNAANPNLPLKPMFAFVNSPSSIRVRNVPKRIGDWCIRKVYFTAVYPDSTVKTAECVLTGGVWVGTIEGTNTSGTSKNGYTIFADGTDENGNNVTGYVLGKGDINILEADGSITPGQNFTYVHLLSAQSQTPKQGDMWPLSDGYMIWQDGEAHRVGGVPSYIQDADGNKIEADRTCSWKSKSSWYITSLENGYYNYDPPLECAWTYLTYLDDGTPMHKWMWMSVVPYSSAQSEQYIGIDPDVEYVEYYIKSGGDYIVQTGNPIEEHTDNSITLIGTQPCSITRTGEWTDNTGTLATEGYVDGIVGNINSILDAINGEVI